MISLITYTPQKIQHVVKSMWMLQVNAGSEWYEEDIIPDAHHEIIFHVNGHDANRQSPNETWIKEPDAFIAGQTVTSYKLRLQQGARLYGIRFYPHTLYALSGVPCHLLNDKLFSLSDVFEKAEFHRCITSAANKTFLNFEELLVKKLSCVNYHSAGYNYVQAAISAILSQHGNIAVDELIKRTGISGKHLDNLFDKYVGLGPKTISRIIQLNRFISYKASQPHKTLTESSYEAGYYDQAHLIKSFRSFTNTSPSAFFKKAGSINDFFAQL